MRSPLHFKDKKTMQQRMRQQLLFKRKNKAVYRSVSLCNRQKEMRDNAIE